MRGSLETDKSQNHRSGHSRSLALRISSGGWMSAQDALLGPPATMPPDRITPISVVSDLDNMSLMGGRANLRQIYASQHGPRWLSG